MEWVTTSTILRDLRDYSNEQAWERFAARFRRPVVRFARTLGLSASDAEDVAQETLIAFAEGLRRGQYDREKGRLSRWLFGIAYRQALSGRRADARDAARIAPEAAGPGFWPNLPDESAATESWDREWDALLLEECLARVREEVEPATYRAFELVVREERTPADAASQLNLTVKSVYNAKHRILKRIRELRADLEAIE